MKNKSPKHWIVLALCCLMVTASLGLMANTSGVFYTPVAEDLGISTGAFALQQTIFLIVVSLGAYFVPTMVKKFNFRLVLAVAVAVNAFSIIMMSMVSSLIAFYILGVIRGLSASFFFMVPVSMIITNWFEEKRGLAMSIAMCFNGMSALFSPLFTGMIGAIGWRMSYVVMAAMIVILCLPAIIYPWNFNPRSDGLLAYGHVDEEVLTKATVTHKKEEMSIIMLITFIIFALTTFGVTSMAQHFPGYATSINLTIGATMLSMTMIGNILATVTCGSVADKLGVVKATLIYLAIGTIGMTIMLLIHVPVIMLAGAFLFGFDFPMGSVILPLLTEKFFGIVNYNTVYPTLALAGNIGAASYLTIIGFIYDGAKSYIPAVIICVAMMLLAIGMVVLNVMAHPDQQVAAIEEK
ncbi:MAG: MFS transporter [Erysipelotrichaceae bacterium]|nr:MFS transporter [Erysipelotrichaceae bacterium]